MNDIERKTPKNFERIVKEVEDILFKEMKTRFNAKSVIDKMKDKMSNENNSKDENDKWYINQ